MKKTTQKSFSKRLAQYGALTVAIAGVADASGQIIYTDIAPDYNGGINTDYALDLNNDGTVDFNLNQEQESFYSIVDVNRLRIFPLNVGNEVLGEETSAGNFAYPFALNSGDVISNGQTFWNNNGFSSGVQSLNYTVSYSGNLYTDGNFAGVTDKYLGLRFDVSGQTYYGWARLDVNLDGSAWVVKDYAYNSVAEEPINAGQTTLGLGVNDLAQIKIVALNRSIALYNLPENTSYRLFSTSGQAVLNGTLTSGTSIIEANSVANGIYVLELIDGNTHGVIRKKVVL